MFGFFSLDPLNHCSVDINERISLFSFSFFCSGLLHSDRRKITLQKIRIFHGRSFFTRCTGHYGYQEGRRALRGSGAFQVVEPSNEINLATEDTAESTAIEESKYYISQYLGFLTDPSYYLLLQAFESYYDDHALCLLQWTAPRYNAKVSSPGFKNYSFNNFQSNRNSYVNYPTSFTKSTPGRSNLYTDFSRYFPLGCKSSLVHLLLFIYWQIFQSPASYGNYSTVPNTAQ